MRPTFPSGRDLDRQLDALEAPEGERLTSGPLLQSLFRIAHIEDALDAARPTVCKELTKLAQLAEKFRASFDKMSDEAKARIRLLPSWSGYESACSFFDDIIGLCRPKAAERWGGLVGRPISCTPACEQFVLMLYAGEADGHWRVSVDPADPSKGTLPKFLKRAKPYLPVRFHDGSSSTALKHFQKLNTVLKKADPDEPGWFSKMVGEIEAAYGINPGT